MTLRVARHTNDLGKLVNFYVNILGFERLGGFQDHNNYDGAFIGKPDLGWHFEFTKSHDKANHTSDEDDAIVLYPETILEYNRLVVNIINNDISFITAKNPYWNLEENGKMFLDPDGFRIIISPLKAK